MSGGLVILGKLTYDGKQADQALISHNSENCYIKDFMQKHVEK
jgi:hypothetical protein